MERIDRDNRIILCATQRCGSTLVVEDMRNSGVLGQPKEWFLPWKSSKDGNAQERDWNKSLAMVYKRGRGENGIFSVKIMANQLFDIDMCLSSFATVKPINSGPFPYVASEFEGAVWVWLRRRDIVAQAISRLIARQTKVNHATANPEDVHFAGNLMRGLKPDYNQAATYNYAAIRGNVTAISLENLAWADFFQSNQISPLILEYEDVITDPSMKHLSQMGALIGQGASPPRQARKMVKLGNEVNQDWRARFMAEAAENYYR